MISTIIDFCLDYLKHGKRQDELILDLTNPNTLDKIVIGQGRVNDNRWCCVSRDAYTRDPVIVAREKRAAAMGDFTIKSPVVKWRRSA
jgi:hypothetical protein